MRSSERIIIAFASIIFIALMSLLAIDNGKYDLRFSLNFANRSSAFGIFFNQFGEIPGWITVFLFSSAYIFKENKLTIFTSISLLYDIICVVGFMIRLDIVSVLLLVSLLSTLSYYLATLLESEKINYLTYLSQFFLLLFPGIIITTIKHIWGRIRFRDLLSIEDFTPWYFVNGYTGNRSFPSGHVSMGIMVFPLINLILLQIKSKQLKIGLILPLILWPILVALGRIRYGDHYASDVIFSIFIGSVLYYYLSNRFKSYLEDQ
ncbi:MAG: phosphatase PAP2 family protein [Candidatus Heimdallarchaeota archaeon]|nr:phosphatase PAP2 family protein [Candidatus Heimdallarchaeota archaeon]